jgi:hypothetical protein
MFVEPFLDNPSFVAWGFILLNKIYNSDGYTAAVKGCT